MIIIKDYDNLVGKWLLTGDSNFQVARKSDETKADEMKGRCRIGRLISDRLRLKPFPEYIMALTPDELNVQIHRQNQSKLAELEARIDAALLRDYNADGRPVTVNVSTDLRRQVIDRIEQMYRQKGWKVKYESFSDCRNESYANFVFNV